MKGLQAALYARVSTESQTKHETVQSQLAAIRERAGADGCPVLGAYEFVDEGYSGSTLARPGLDRLRDQVAAGAVDRLYLYAPDRLARKTAYQALLMEEFKKAGVEVVFVNYALGDTPLDEFMRQIQAAYAEFERGTIMERIRRGKRFAARKGAVSALGKAPYGYRYLPKGLGGGEARWELVPDQAVVVQNLFEWVGGERLTCYGPPNPGVPRPRFLRAA